MRFAIVVASVFSGAFLAAVLVLWRPLSATSKPGHAPVATAPPPMRPFPQAQQVVSSDTSDITAVGPGLTRTDNEQRTSLDDVHYIPPVGLRVPIQLVDEDKSILRSRLERLISAKIGRIVAIPRAWAFKERDGDITICGAYMGLTEAIIFVYNTGGPKGSEPALYLNIDQETYSSFACEDASAVPLIGA
jgi:hypothetical protein